MDIFERIQSEKDLRLSVWSKDLKIDPASLFGFCCSSLIFDYNHLEKRNFKKGDVVELTLSLENSVRRFYFRYEGFEDYNGINRIILKVLGGKTCYKLNTSQFIWRLNTFSGKINLSSDKKLKKVPFSVLNPPSGIDDPIRILSEKIGIPNRDFNFFHRSKILILLNESLEQLVKDLKEWHFHNHCFLDYFPAYIVSDDNWKKINSEKFDRSEPERILYFFHNLIDLLNFINKQNSGKNFFIISDHYTRLFNLSSQQYLIKTLLRTDINLRVMFVGHINHFKKLNREENVILSNKYIVPCILNANLSTLKSIKKKVEDVGDQQTNELIYECYNFSKTHMDINPYFASELKKNIFALMSYNRYETPIFKKSFEQFCKEYSAEKIVDKLKLLNQKMLNNHFKKLWISENNTIVTDITIDTTNNVIGKKQFKETFLAEKSGNKHVLTFVNNDFLNDFLFPAILMKYSPDLELIFKLYKIETKVLESAIMHFIKKYKDFLEDIPTGDIYSTVQEPVDNIDDGVTLYEFDLSLIDFPTYNSSQKKTEAITLELEDDEEEYIAYFSKNYTPTVITSDSIYNITLDELEIGDELIFLPGVRNVFHKFSEVFENKIIEIELRNKWKEALQEYLLTHSFRSLVKILKANGIDREEGTIRNWLNNSSVIGTLHPIEDFQKIAIATNNTFLISNYKRVAEVCLTLQKMSKILGKKMKKLTLAALRGTSINAVLEDYDSQVQKRIEETLSGIKIVTVTNIYNQYKEIDYGITNQLIEKTKFIHDSVYLKKEQLELWN